MEGLSTWADVRDGVIASVMVCRDSPGRSWRQYPYPCDVCGPMNVAGRGADEFDASGNFREET